MKTNLNPDARAVSAPFSRGAGAPRCNEGVAAIDSVLCELSVHDSTLLDAILDLRMLAAECLDAAAFLGQLFRVRMLLSGRQRLAFVRVCVWAMRAIQVEVRTGPNEPWYRFKLRADCARVDEAANTALAYVARGDFIPACAEVRFVFGSEESRLHETTMTRR